MASTVKPQHRIFALVMALLFLGTAIAGSAIIVWQIQQDTKRDQMISEAQEALQQQDSQNNQTTPQEGKLEGTQLANFTPSTEKVSQLQITDLKEGTGEPVKAGGTVTAHYTGALVSTGVIFQSSKDTGQAFTSPLGGLIKGWQDGIPGMKPGGIRRLVIPADLAYGSSGQGNIPPNSDLVFDIELVSAQ